MKESDAEQHRRLRLPELRPGKETFGLRVWLPQVVADKRIQRKKPEANALGLLCNAAGREIRRDLGRGPERNTLRNSLFLS